MQGWERVIPPSPITPAPQYQHVDRKRKIVQYKKVWSSLIESKSIVPAPENQKSHTVEYWVKKIVRVFLVRPEFECCCCKVLFFIVCGVRQNLYVFSLYLNTD